MMHRHFNLNERSHDEHTHTNTYTCSILQRVLLGSLADKSGEFSKKLSTLMHLFVYLEGAKVRIVSMLILSRPCNRQNAALSSEAEK